MTRTVREKDPNAITISTLCKLCLLQFVSGRNKYLCQGVSFAMTRESDESVAKSRVGDFKCGKIFELEDVSMASPLTSKVIIKYEVQKEFKRTFEPGKQTLEIITDPRREYVYECLNYITDSLREDRKMKYVTIRNRREFLKST